MHRFLCALIAISLSKKVNYLKFTRKQYSLLTIYDDLAASTVQCTKIAIYYPRIIELASSSVHLNTSCRFVPNVFYNFCSDTKSLPVPVCIGQEWYCSPKEILKCNGYSQCLYDECNCAGVDVFFCADKRGCVTLKQVCDVIPDCLDASDEHICPNLQQLEYKNTAIMVSDSFYCKGYRLGYPWSYPLNDVYESGFVVPNCTLKNTALTNCITNTLYEYGMSLNYYYEYDNANIPLRVLRIVPVFTQKSVRDL